VRSSLAAILVCCTALCGCGTTNWTDTRRTATEQLLISDAMDRVVSKLDFRAVAGKTVYLDSKPLSGVTDSAYLISVLRQHMLASGCILKDSREEANYVIEVRSGAVGTDRREVMIGMPATQITGMLPVNGIPASIPEMPLAKKTEQRAVAKIALFAYNRKTGRPVWQSGTVPVESKAKNIWVLGAGPFERGTIFEGTKFVGSKIKIPLVSPGEHHDKHGLIAVADEAYFTESQEEIDAAEAAIAAAAAKAYAAKAVAGRASAVATSSRAKKKPAVQPGKVVPAAHATPVAKSSNDKTPPPAKATPPAKSSNDKTPPPAKVAPPAKPSNDKTPPPAKVAQTPKQAAGPIKVLPQPPAEPLPFHPHTVPAALPPHPKAIRGRRESVGD